VEDGVSGVVAPPDPDALAESIDRLWDLPEERLKEMGAEGHRRVEGISWDGVIDRLTESIR
jgi:glycosyltransferase involved in cell wall biosynthesis